MVLGPIAIHVTDAISHLDTLAVVPVPTGGVHTLGAQCQAAVATQVLEITPSHLDVWAYLV